MDGYVFVERHCKSFPKFCPVCEDMNLFARANTFGFQLIMHYELCIMNYKLGLHRGWGEGIPPLTLLITNKTGHGMDSLSNEFMPWPV